MFAYEPALNPPFDEWSEYTLPLFVHARIEEICHDILARGDKTRFKAIYQALEEMVADDIECEKMVSLYDASCC